MAEKRKLLMFSITKMHEALAKGNVWYVSHYAAYFDQVQYLYMLGRKQEPATRGSTRLFSLATGRPLLDGFLMPFRIVRHARAYKPSHYLTADILTSWSVAIFLRIFLNKPLLVMPVCTPGDIYLNSGKTFSGLPKWLEDFLIDLSFRFAGRLVVTEHSLATRKWLLESKFAYKTRVVISTPEELPSPDFFEALQEARDAPLQSKRLVRPRLIYVGRLAAEKLVADLIPMAATLNAAGHDFELLLVGDGVLRESLEREVNALGLEGNVTFAGGQPAAEIARLLASSTMFVSTLTGTALKEAGLARLPVIAYRIDYVANLLTDEENVLFVERGDINGLATAVARLINDVKLSEHLANNLHEMTVARWSIETTRQGLAQMIEGIE
jgi:glycosyltransferase involved in cell wall biosynthesis